MARVAREDVFSPDEVAIVHVMNRVVRRCFLLGEDSVTGKNYDHRKAWIEGLFQHCAACFGIDLLAFAILSNHFHVVVRSRPDVVATWDDTEVARRWLMLCPLRRQNDGTPAEPNDAELNSILIAGKQGCTPDHVPPILARLSLEPETWCALVRNFGGLFFHVAGRPQTVDQYRSPLRDRRFHLRAEVRHLLATST